MGGLGNELQVVEMIRGACLAHALRDRAVKSPEAARGLREVADAMTARTAILAGRIAAGAQADSRASAAMLTVQR
jgi:hypothetical protein